MANGPNIFQMLLVPRKQFPRSILVTSSRGCPQQVVRVRLVEFGERHNTRTTGHAALYTAADRRPTNRVSAWQAEWESRPARPTRATSSQGSSRESRAYRRRCHKDAARKLLPWNSDYAPCHTPFDTLRLVIVDPSECLY